MREQQEVRAEWGGPCEPHWGFGCDPLGFCGEAIECFQQEVTLARSAAGTLEDHVLGDWLWGAGEVADFCLAASPW